MNRRSVTLSVAVVLIGMLAPTHGLRAQTMYGPTFGISQSLSHTKEFADDLSLRNLSGELRTMISGNFALGASIGWHVFHEEEEMLSTLPGTSVTASGLQYRTVNAIPMMVGAYRYFGEPRTRRLFIGAGVGTTYTRHHVDLGILGRAEDEWGFSVAPEIGLLRPFRGETELLFSAKYLWTSGDLGGQALVFGVGIMSWPFLS